MNATHALLAIAGCLLLSINPVASTKVPVLSKNLRSQRRRQLQTAPITLQLVEPVYKRVISNLDNGTVINLNRFGTSSFLVRSTTSDTTIQSVYFVWIGGSYNHNDNSSPYDMFSSARNFSVGTYTFSATPYPLDNKGGTPGPTTTVTFSMIREGPMLLQPQFVGNWTSIPNYPINVGESQGGRVGPTDLVSNGGYPPNLKSVAPDTYSLDLSNPSATWRRLANFPVPPYVTHVAHAVKGELIYYCGGYTGANPGPQFIQCFVFDKNNGATGSWTSLPSLPAGRGGAGMVYIESFDVLVLSMGAERPNGLNTTSDKSDTWMLSLSNLPAGWISKATAPYLANHITALTAYDCDGSVHYYFFGGQQDEHEQYANVDSMFEYIPATDQWVQRQKLLEGRGHMSSSAVAYGCGFIVVGGSINGPNPNKRTQTDQIWYYHIPTDSWVLIGTYVVALNSPVCGIYADYITCTNGFQVEGYKRQLSFPAH